jgi:photosystem II stability/assembly factor-like uncharacterized protein
MHEYADGAHFLTNAGGTAIYRSLTGTATWATLVSAVPGAITAWQVVDANTIMVGGVDVVYQSTNGGVIWFTRTAGSGGNAITAFALEPVTGDILAGTNAPGVFLSTDNGATWTSQGAPSTLTAVNAVGFSAAYDTKGVIYAAGTGVTGGVEKKVAGVVLTTSSTAQMVSMPWPTPALQLMEPSSPRLLAWYRALADLRACYT